MWSDHCKYNNKKILNLVSCVAVILKSSRVNKLLSRINYSAGQSSTAS